MSAGSGSNMIFVAASVAGTSDGGPVAAMLCDSLIKGQFGGDVRQSEIVGDRMLIEEGRRRERALRKARVKQALRGVVAWGKKAACFSI